MNDIELPEPNEGELPWFREFDESWANWFGPDPEEDLT